MAQAHFSIKVFSRPGVNDECDLGKYEYNGSYGQFLVPTDSLLSLSEEDKQGIAKAMDCFAEVLFIIEGKEAISFTRDYL